MSNTGKTNNLASGVTPAAILEQLRHHNASDLKSLQSQLTVATNQIQKVLDGPLGYLLSQYETKLLSESRKLLNRIRVQTANAKDLRAKHEANRQSQIDQVHKATRRAIAAAYPVPEITASMDDLLEAARLLIAASSHRSPLGYVPKPKGTSASIHNAMIGFQESAITHVLDTCIYHHIPIEQVVQELSAFLSRPFHEGEIPLFQQIQQGLAVEFSSNVTPLKNSGGFAR